MRIWSGVGLRARNMAEPHVLVLCVPREIFYEQLDALKNKQTKNESQITLFIEDSFFDKAKAYLSLEFNPKNPCCRSGKNQIIIIIIIMAFI